MSNIRIKLVQNPAPNIFCCMISSFLFLAISFFFVNVFSSHLELIFYSAKRTRNDSTVFELVDTIFHSQLFLCSRMHVHCVMKQTIESIDRYVNFDFCKITKPPVGVPLNSICRGKIHNLTRHKRFKLRKFYFEL